MSLGSLFKFENLFSKGIGRDVLHDPSRLLTGVDPASTGIWNKVLGTDKKPLVNAFGSPGEQYYQEANSKGIDTGSARGFHHVADAVAAYYGAQGLAGIGGGGGEAGAGGETGGGSAGQGMGGKGDIVQAMMKMQPQQQQTPYQAHMVAIPDGTPQVTPDERVQREQLLKALMARGQV
jgi:hypothetical protein